MRNNVWVQNDLVAVISGSVQAAISGNVIYIGDTSGINIAQIGDFSDDFDSPNSRGLRVSAYLRALDVGSNRVVRIRASAPVSGGGYILHALISGQPVRLVNDGVNNVVKISGQVVYNYGTSIVTAPMVSCAGTSGGTTMPTQACVKCRIRSVSGNDVMFVGGIGAQAPFSGKGQQLYGGEALDYDVNNFNAVSVFAATAGQQVSIDGAL